MEDDKESIDPDRITTKHGRRKGQTPNTSSIEHLGSVVTLYRMAIENARGHLHQGNVAQALSVLDEAIIFGERQ